jgi:GNAT superfamily N-acetyltransferase
MKIQQIDPSSPLYEAAVNVWNNVWPKYPEDKEEWAHFDLHYDPKYFFQRFVFNNDEKVVATGVVCEPWWSYKPGKLYFEINVLQEFRNRGIGTICFKYIEDMLRKRKGNKLTAHTKEDQLDGVRFLEKRDFNVVLKEPESKLDVRNFDFNRFEYIGKKIKAEGIEIRSLHELQSNDTTWKQKLYGLYCKIMRDVPSDDEHTERTLENFEKQKLKAPGFEPRANFIALDNGRYVGLSSLWRQKRRPKVFWTDLTGVVRSHRRKGLALALKIQTVRFAREFGAEHIETDNEENNPMFRLNQLLGFVPLPAWLTFEKRYQSSLPDR